MVKEYQPSNSLAERLVGVCEDSELGPVLGPYITHFQASELVNEGKISIEDRAKLVEIGM